MQIRNVLIIDDEEKLRSLLAKIISLEGFEVFQAADGASAMKRMEQAEIDVVICDVKLPDGSGIELSSGIKKKYPTVEVILLTAYGNIPDSVEAIKNGAFDYITKADDNIRIIPLLYKAMEKVALSKRVLQLEKQLGKKYSFEGILGQSKQIKSVIESAMKVAATDATVLLTGETGTGKEVFAHAIHNHGSRSRQNFIAINCAAFSRELLENELFGHKAGAFTGAIKDSKGIFEEANGGTVFLDELGEMPMELQAKLLRVLETGEFLKVGDNKPTRTDVRIIAATNKDLQVEIKAGNFREDLFYRVSVFQLRLPALRERVEDIKLIAEHFISSFSAKSNKKIPTATARYFSALEKHAWRGNIRELKNVIERSIILTADGELQADSLPADFYGADGSSDPSAAGIASLELSNAEQLHIRKVLKHTNGNKTEAAKLLNIALTTLYRKIEEYQI